MIAIILSLTVVTAPVTAPADTLALSLAEATERAREENRTVRAELAEARAVAQDATEATRAFLPTIRAEVQGVRTTDPVGVFGLKLRQSVFQPADFDIDALNNPASFSGFTSMVMAELPVIAPEGLFGHGAAKSAGRARQAQAERMAGATAFQVRMSYWDAQLAAGRLDALRAAIAAAEAHEAAAAGLRDQGIVTGLDARLAGLRVSGLRVQLLAAEADADNARTRLKTLLAIPEETELRLTDALGTPTPTDAPSEDAAPTGGALGARGDLRALEAAASATRSARKSAWGAQFPQVVAFGGVSYHGADTPWDNGSGDWTLGVGVRWNVFPGLSGVAAVRRSRAKLDAAEARLEAGLGQAAEEAQATRRNLEAAREAVVIAEAAESEAVLAAEQARERYQQGIAPITELLDVEAARTDASLTRLMSVRNLYVAQAALEFAYGVFDR